MLSLCMTQRSLQSQIFIFDYTKNHRRIQEYVLFIITNQRYSHCGCSLFSFYIINVFIVLSMKKTISSGINLSILRRLQKYKWSVAGTIILGRDWWAMWPHGLLSHGTKHPLQKDLQLFRTSGEGAICVILKDVNKLTLHTPAENVFL
jgi:hypothetical protein